jgi:hypothetical protein
MVVAVCAAVVLAPVGVMAATGTLVNIADPGNAARVARVGSGGTLQVESRAGSVANSFNTFHDNVADFVKTTVYEATAPSRVAVTEATFTLDAVDTSPSVLIEIYSRVRTSGTAPCSNGTGWSEPRKLRSVLVRGNDMVQLLFNGPPLISQAAPAGQRTCIGFWTIQTRNGGGNVDVGMTGYTFS